MSLYIILQESTVHFFDLNQANRTSLKPWRIGRKHFMLIIVVEWVLFHILMNTTMANLDNSRSSRSKVIQGSKMSKHDVPILWNFFPPFFQMSELKKIRWQTFPALEYLRHALYILFQKWTQRMCLSLVIACWTCWITSYLFFYKHILKVSECFVI